MGETAKADLNATTYVHQPTLPLLQGDDEMRVSDWTAGVECDGAGVSGTRAGMRPKCLLIILRSLSELALLDLPSSLAGALSTSSQTGHPCRSLMICRTQQSAFSRTFMPVAVARLTHNIFFSRDTPFLSRTRHLFASYPRVLSRQTSTIVPRSATKAVQTSPINPPAAARALTQGSLPAAR